MDNREFFLGLDVGTNSVGWAAVDSNYQPMRIKGKTAWGARIFDESTGGAKNRRMFRTNKRRIARRKYRLKLLENLFAPYIQNDPTFFLRLAYSNLHQEDIPSNLDFSCPLFKNKSLEKEYYKKYPTIWHLRKALLENQKDAYLDIRHVFLAIHHMIKYRGNFLNEGIEINPKKFEMSTFVTLNEALKKAVFDEEDADTDMINGKDGENIIAILLNNDLNRLSKQKNIKALFPSDIKNPWLDLISKLLTGSKFSLGKLFDSPNIETICFDQSFDENEDNFKSIFGDTYTIIEQTKKIHDYIVLYEIVGDHPSLSYGMVEVYTRHKSQLRSLKKLFIDFDKLTGSHEAYTKMFKDKSQPLSYAAYIDANCNETKPSVTDINKEILRWLTDFKQKGLESPNGELDRFITLAENSELLLRISDVSTSIIPHQLHKNELVIILDNAIKYYPSLAQIKDKILGVFMHKIPYFYGPLDDRSPYSAVVRKSNDIITPWNMNEVIDEEKTREKFIGKLTKTCLFLPTEKVLPKQSIIYQDYILFDRLNTLEINGGKLDYDTKMRIFDYVCARGKVTIKQLRKHLTAISSANQEVVLSKIADDVELDASSRKTLSSFINLDDDLVVAEHILFLYAIYSDDVKTAASVVKKSYPSIKKECLDMVAHLHVKGWGSFSKQLLTGIHSIDDNGVAQSILDVLKTSTLNFQQVLHAPYYHFQDEIENYKRDNMGSMLPNDMVEQLLSSLPSPFRRPIYQAIRIVDEIVTITNKEPAKLFIEVTRENDINKKGKVTDNRRKELNAFIASLKKDTEYKDACLGVEEELKQVDLAKLKGKHLFLYFKQLGFDIYTGEKIKIEDVFDSTKYDVDHIVPQSLIKDDSLDNLVLVSRTINQNVKKDIYPLPLSLQTEKVKRLWHHLHKHKAISDKKFNNLIRTTPISDTELNEFVQRQINVVNYANIAIRDVLAIKYPNTKIVFSKAQYVAYTRQSLDIVKIRELKDYHHAIDAYLNCVIGDIVYKKFSNINALLTAKSRGENVTFNVERIIDFALRKQGLSERVIHNAYRHDFLITYMFDYVNAEFYKQTIQPASSSSALVPIHSSSNHPMHDTTKYGGYIEAKTAFMLPITFTKGKKVQKQLFRVPLLLQRQAKGNLSIIVEQLIQDNNIKSSTPIQIGKPIFANQKAFFNGLPVLLKTKGDTLNLEIIKPLYLTQYDCSFLGKAKRFRTYLESNNDIVKVVYDKDLNNVFEFSKTKFFQIFSSIISSANHPLYHGCPMAESIRDFSNKQEEFFSLTMKQEFDLIINMIMSLSTDARQAKSLESFRIKSLWTTTLNITNVTLIIVNESITGLFSNSYAV